MICTKSNCGGALRVTRSYVAGNARTTTQECVVCGARYTGVAHILGESAEVGSAYIVAEKMRRRRGRKK